MALSKTLLICGLINVLDPESNLQLPSLSEDRIKDAIGAETYRPPSDILYITKQRIITFFWHEQHINENIEGPQALTHHILHARKFKTAGCFDALVCSHEVFSNWTNKGCGNDVRAQNAHMTTTLFHVRY